MQVFQEHRPYNPDFPISITKSHNLTYMPHWHIDVELVLVSRGSVRMGVNQESHILKAGDTAIAGSRDIHYFENIGKDTILYIIIFHPEVVGYPSGWPEERRLLYPFLNHLSVHDDSMKDRLMKSLRDGILSIYQEQEARTEGHRLFIKSHLFEICGSLMRYFPSEPIDTQKEQHRLRNLKRMQEVVRFIEANYTHHITLEDAAAQAKLSPFHFSRLFKSTLGMSFKAYVNRIRVNKAEVLLQDTDLSVTDIAFECGFESIRTFNRVYKSAKGFSPSGMR